MIATALTIELQHLRDACDEDIRTGFENIKTSLRRIGAALKEVRNQRLYLSTHTTFEEYVSQQWKLSRARAYQLIDHANTVASLGTCDALSTIVDTISEGATRELSGMGADSQKAVVMLASSGGTIAPTACEVRSARMRVEREQPLAIQAQVNRVTAPVIEPPQPPVAKEVHQNPFKEMVQRYLERENPIQVVHDAIELLKGISRQHPHHNRAWMIVRDFIDTNINKGQS